MEINDLGNTPAQQAQMDALADDHDERAAKMHDPQTPFLERLRDLCGYVQNATDTVVTIFQDDATHDFIVKVGKKSYHGASINVAFEAAFADPKNNPF